MSVKKTASPLHILVQWCLAHRMLVRNLFLGYLSSPAGQREQVLPVLATVLGLSHDERARVGITRDGSIGTV